MKKIFFALFALTAVILSSCSNKVELYNNDGDTTVVYALLDAYADTNFFKITKSFVGNVSEQAYNYDANNYKYDEIDVTLTGVFKDSGNTQTITLDTISKWIPYDENAQFYSGCWQRYYYTTKTLSEGEEYELDILRKEDGVTVSATTKTINEFIYQKPASPYIGFSDLPTGTAFVEWRVNQFPYKSTAAYFEVTGYFHYKELMPGTIDTVARSMKWSLGSGEADNLYNTSTNMPYYVISYTPSALYTLLENDDYLKNNSPVGVQRWFEDFEFSVSATGNDLYNYYLVTNSASAIQDVPNYTNVENGMGIMSSRVTKSLKKPVQETTRKKIIERFENYGFINDPNR